MNTQLRLPLLSLALAGFASACGVDIRDDGNNSGGECSSSADDCFGDDICIRGFCEPAYPRTYQLTIDEVALPPQDLNGQCWDVPCGPPDPYVVVRVDGREIGATLEATDTFDASWSDVFTFTLDFDSNLEINLYDADVDTDDEALDCSSRPINTEVLRTRALICGSRGQSNYLQASILPID